MLGFPHFFIHCFGSICWFYLDDRYFGKNAKFSNQNVDSALLPKYYRLRIAMDHSIEQKFLGVRYCEILVYPESMSWQYYPYFQPQIRNVFEPSRWLEDGLYLWCMVPHLIYCKEMYTVHTRHRSIRWESAKSPFDFRWFHLLADKILYTENSLLRRKLLAQDLRQTWQGWNIFSKILEPNKIDGAVWRFPIWNLTLTSTRK